VSGPSVQLSLRYDSVSFVLSSLPRCRCRRWDCMLCFSRCMWSLAVGVPCSPPRACCMVRHPVRPCPFPLTPFAFLEVSVFAVPFRRRPPFIPVCTLWWVRGMSYPRRSHEFTSSLHLRSWVVRVCVAVACPCELRAMASYPLRFVFPCVPSVFCLLSASTLTPVSSSWLFRFWPSFALTLAWLCVCVCRV
jgi:hypothetical protein